jgi:hypothetical protein
MIHSRSGFWRWRLTFAAVVGSLLSWGASVNLFAQGDYKVWPTRDKTNDLRLVDDDKPKDTVRAINEKKQNVRQHRNSIIEILKGDAPFSGDNEKALVNWYNNYEFPILTIYDPAELRVLPESKTDLYEGRKRLFRDQIEKASNKDAHERVVQLAFDFFSVVAVEEYHPAVRYNAMLIIGDLNESERTGSGSDSEAPRPLPAALAFMVKQWKSPDQLDAVRVAALIGILRHVQIEAQAIGRADTPKNADQTTEIRQLALDLVRTRKAPEGRSQEGHDWMRRRGIEILSWLAAIKLDQEIVDLVVERLADSEENRGVREEAALAIHNMKYLPEPGRPRLGTTAVDIKLRKVAAYLVQFILDATTEDMKNVDKYLVSLQEAEEIYGTGGMSGGGGGQFGRPSAGGTSRGGPPPGMGSSKGGPPPGAGGSKGGPPPSMGGSKGGPPPGAGGSKGGPPPGAGGSKGGPPPGAGGSTKGSKGSTARSGGQPTAGAGSFGGFGGGGSGMGTKADPYGFRLEPVYRKLRHEIGYAMKGLRGTEEWSKRDPILQGGHFGGLYKLFGKPAAADSESEKKEVDPKVAADKDFLARAGKALKDLSDALKPKTDELDTTKFTPKSMDKIIEQLNGIVTEGAGGKAAKVKKTDEPEIKDPLTEPDPAEEPAPAKPDAAAAKPAAPEAEAAE